MKKRLSDLAFGETGIIHRIDLPEHELNRLGVRLKKSIRMITHQPIKGPVVIVIDGMEVAMGLSTAEQIVIDLEYEE